MESSILAQVLDICLAGSKIKIQGQMVMVEESCSADGVQEVESRESDTSGQG